MEPVLPQLVAHRGYPDRYPENTLRGVRAAIEAGALHVEFDVQMSADNELVVIHDDNLQRTANIDQSVFDATVAQLRKISVHEADRFGDNYADEFIPTLKQMLELVSRHSQVTAYIEIKEESLDRFGVNTVVDSVIDAVDDFIEQSVIISFSAEAIGYVREHSSIRTGWVLHVYDDEFHQRAFNIRPDFLICNQRKVSVDEPLWQGEWQWMLYGVETCELAIEWAQRGIPFVETDRIGELAGTC